ncbi:Cullin-domain-containing protein [Testicularia cyperi]|uniref:Cullin-domain-containing protein n=1 Tax=Testicularia cyperi TaxID=1882483 RepID=A0A317XNE6_9BASI|nr:Cullin-domain-containing protein [Testicularia cyperi]
MMASVPRWAPGILVDALRHRSEASDGSQLDANHSERIASRGGFSAFLVKASSTQSSANSGGAATVKLTRVEVASLDTQRSQPSPDYLYRSTALLVRSVRLILSGDATAQSKSLSPLQTLYETTHNLVQYSSAQAIDDLYDTLKLEIERAAGMHASALRAAGSSEASVESHITWLARLQSTWSAWCDNVTLVRNLLLPLDRQLGSTGGGNVIARDEYGDNSDVRLPIWDLALDIFGHRILRDDELCSMILERIATAVNADRRSALQYRATHASLAEMFVALRAEAVLDEALQKATAAFYREESSQSFANMTPGDYILYADGRVSQETERSEWCLLTAEGRKANVSAALEQLVAVHAPKLLAGLAELIDTQRLDELTKLYTLTKSVGRLTDVRKGFADHIKSRGEAIVSDRAKDDDMIERLLAFKASIDTIVQHAFQRDIDLVHAQRDSFEVFINRRENKPAELIAKFLDAKLRSGNKTMTDEELEHNLDEALILFRFTHAKDMFEEFYKRYFAKRLLLNRSASSDAERSMLLKLKEECGPEFTAKLETMIKDVDVSKDLMDEYERFVAKKAKEQLEASGGANREPFVSPSEPIDLSVSVLTQAQWPTYPQLEVVLPNELSTAAEQFTDFYQTRNSGRRLHWQHSLGTVSIQAHFPKAGSKELHVSTFQAIVLMLFNRLETGERLSYRDVRTETALEDKELKRTLQSLACGQIPTRVLRKIPQGKEVEDDDEFTVNENFKNERHRIRINQIQMKETAEEQKSTEQRVFLDRELILQAAAVRVLKAKKTIKHTELITEVVDQIKSRFSVEVSEIKKVFEILIDKDYMERVEGQRGMYRYLA